MTRRARRWLIAGATLIALCGGITLTPQYQARAQVLKWVQRYPSTDAARDALARNPRDVRAHRTLAWDMMERDSAPGESRKQRLQRCLVAWEAVVQCDPSDEFAQYRVADYAATLGDFDRARRILKSIIAHGNPQMVLEAAGLLGLINDPNSFYHKKRNETDEATRVTPSAR